MSGSPSSRASRANRSRRNAVRSSDVKAFESAPSNLRTSLYFSWEYLSVPRNIMCSKKWANPESPFSTSFRDPVRTTV